MLEARDVTCWDVTNPRRKRVRRRRPAGARRRDPRHRRTGGRGPHRIRVGDLRRLCRPQHAQVRVAGQPVRIACPADAIAHGLCLVPEDRKRHGIVPLMSVAENITLASLADHARAARVDGDAELATVEREIARLRIKTASPGLPVASLSGGNQQKVVLAKMALKNPKVLILDEPTRGVDIGAKYESTR
ncbi:ATP-binding cassette domain-containing protein [Achromobacter xylosoxidans]|uniref:ATP-binding cassette domain-containing protein n=1 Tax=Alcaligenes xylosoxydans xylosoxydans TaxID=85698 RepID=UPI0022B294F3|nr:ATP-binding cassette domain-containing protein [Achromobacter xylosoxidans]